MLPTPNRDLANKDAVIVVYDDRGVSTYVGYPSCTYIRNPLQS